MHYVLNTSTGWAHDTSIVELLYCGVICFLLLHSVTFNSIEKKQDSRVFMFSAQLFNCKVLMQQKDAMKDRIGLVGY
jgi:hypothetical protein